MNDRRSRALIASALGTLLFAILFSLAGSARSSSALWVPSGSESTVRTDLLVARHSPERLALGWDCQAVSDAPSFSTRANGVSDGAMTLTSAPTGWSIAVAGQPLVDFPYVADDCAFVIRPDSGWTATVGDEQIGTGGPQRIIVSSLGGTGLDSIGFTAVAEMRPHGFDAPAWRILLALAAIASAGAVIVFLPGRGPSDRSDVEPVRSLVLTAAAALIPLGLLLVVQPPFEDDGWVLSTVQNFAASAQYGNYYLSWDVMVPIGAPAYELLRLTSEVSTSPLVMRLPALFAAVAMWFVTSATLRRVGTQMGGGAAMVASSMFVLTSVSWLVTLRPEPFTAALAAVCLLLVIAYVQDREMRTLGGAAIAAALSIAIHPAGLVAAAPLVAALPTIVDDLRRGRSKWLQFGSVVAIGASMTAVGLLLRSDIGFWRDATDSSVNPGGLTYTWRDAVVHYEWLFGAGNAPRRLTLLLPLLAICAYLTRLDRTESPASRLPARSFLIGLLLLVPVPSKWLWHFGALSGLGVVVVTHEWWRLGSTWDRTTWYFRAGSLAAVVAVFSIAWRADLEWLSQTPLVSFHHDAGAHDLGFLPFEVSNPLVWLAGALVLSASVHILRRVRGPRPDRRSPTMWLLPVGTSASALLVIGVLVADPIVRAPEWSLAGQLVESVTDSTCGLSDEIIAYEAEVETAEPSAQGDTVVAGFTNLPLAPALADATPEFTRARSWAADRAEVAAVSPWFQRPPSAALWVSVSRLSDDAPLPVVQFGTTTSTTEVAPAGEPIALAANPGGWIHGPLPPGDAHADRVRFVIPSYDEADVGALMITSPYRQGVPLTELVASQPTWVSPYLRFYFPCVVPVPIEAGVAATPRYAIDSSVYSVLSDPSSPWAYLADAVHAVPVRLEWTTGGQPPVVTVTSFRPVVPSHQAGLTISRG